LKEDLLWCHDWDNPFQFQEALRQWIQNYNCDYPHQALNNMTPDQYYQEYMERNSRGLPKSPERVALPSENRSRVPTYFPVA